MIDSCMEYDLLLTDVYLFASWSNMVPHIKKDAAAAETITARSLWYLFEHKG